MNTNLVLSIMVKLLLEWDANPPAENVTHYKVYHGPEIGQYTNTYLTTNTSLPIVLTVPSTNWFAVSAINNIGLESDLSTPVAWGASRPSQTTLRISTYEVITK